jgi:hypothetical protein
MKQLSGFLLLAVLLFGSGCFVLTEMVTERAKAHTRESKKTGKSEDVPANPAYYALMPLTVPADIALTPLELLLFGIWMAAGAPGLTPH